MAGELEHIASPDGGDGFAGLLADFTLALGQFREAMDRNRDAKPRIPWEACHPVWFTGSIPLTAGAGTLQQANLYGPELPYWWDVRSVRFWGWTAGTVTMYRNLTTGEQLGSTASPAEFTWSAQEFLGPQDTMVFGATGITGSVFLAGWAVEVEAAWLAEYLM